MTNHRGPAGDQADWRGRQNLQQGDDHREEVHQERILRRLHEREGLQVEKKIINKIFKDWINFIVSFFI